MKKVFVVSLLLISIFLIGNAEVALAQCQDYQCTGNEMQYRVVTEYFNTCVELCTDGDPYMLYGLWFSGYLYPIDTKNFLGTANSAYGWTGCSVERKGSRIIAKLSYIQEDMGYTDIIRCTPCDDCCF